MNLLVRKVHSLYRKEAKYLYAYMNRDAMIKRIAHAQIGKRGEERNKLSIIVKEIENYLAVEKDKKRIAFIVGHSSPRIYKIMSALQDEGYEICAFASNLMTEHKEWDYIKTLAKDNSVFSSVEELMYLLIKSRAYVAHYFLEWYRLDDALTLMECKEILPVVVVEKYDILNGMYKIKNSFSHICAIHERKIFQKADAICAREYTIPYLRKELGVAIPGTDLILVDGVGESIGIIDEKKEELSLVYVGQLPPSDGKGIVYCQMQFAKLCITNHCHYHVYPSHYDEEGYASYIELSNQSEYFHFHKPVPYTELHYEIMKYDYGVHPGISIDWNKEDDPDYYKAKFRYGVTNKFFDYLGAGLPIVSNLHTILLNKFVEEGMAIEWSISEYDFDYLRENKMAFKSNVIRNRSNWEMNNMIPKLIAFYNEIYKVKELNESGAKISDEFSL